MAWCMKKFEFLSGSFKDISFTDPNGNTFGRCFFEHYIITSYSFNKGRTCTYMVSVGMGVYYMS